MTETHTHDHDHSHRQSPPDHPMDPPQVQEVSEGVFAYIQPDGTWFINNTGFIIGRNEVLAIDATATERRARALLGAIRERTSNPITTLVNTHHHGDHTYGNCVFPEETTIVGHRKCREMIEDEGINTYPGVWTEVNWGNLTARPPTVVFDDAMDLTIDDLRVELRHPGYTAHTSNDVVAWLPDRKVLFAGDLIFHGGTPFLVMGSLEGAKKSVDWLRSFEADVIVPGHGPVCDNAVLDTIERYYAFVEDTARNGLAEGLSPLAAARAADLTPFAALTDPERLVGNLHRAYAELGDGSYELGSAIADMLAYNGNKPLCCVA